MKREVKKSKELQLKRNKTIYNLDIFISRYK